MKRTRRTVTVRRDYDLLSKKESVLAYIDDLHVLVRQNLDEVRARLQEGGGEIPKLRELIDSKLSVVNELKDSSKEDLQSILDLTGYMLENLRFADGRSLKECLEEVRLKRKLKEVDQGSDEDSDEDDGSVKSVLTESIGEEEEPLIAEDGAESRSSSSQSHTDEDGAEDGEHGRGANKTGNAEALEMLVNAEADVNRRKAEFAKGLSGMDDEERRELLDGLGAKLGDLNKEMESQKKL